MEGLRRLACAAVLAAALMGCGKKEAASTDAKPDAYAGMSGEQKIDAIRKDPSINDMQKHQMIADAQKAAGMPVTGQ